MGEEVIDISVVCTNVLFNISRENNKDHLKINRVYKLLAESLAKEATGEELAIQCNQPLIQNERFIPTKHFPRPNTPKPGSKRQRVPSRQCIVCKAKDTRRESTFSCRSCKVPLCISSCFELYHRRRNFQEASLSDDD